MKTELTEDGGMKLNRNTVGSLRKMIKSWERKSLDNDPLHPLAGYAVCARELINLLPGDKPAKTASEKAKEKYHKLKSEGRCVRCGRLLKNRSRNHSVQCMRCRTYLSTNRKRRK